MAAADFSQEAMRIARAFVDARRTGAALADYPGAVPARVAEAYAVQDAAIVLTDAAIGGWKVGRITPPLDGTNRLAGPIFARGIVAASNDPVAMDIFEDGFGAAEAEFLLRIGTAPAAGKTRFTRDEAAALIDAVHIGIEIASSPLPTINELGATVTISDFGNNNGLVVGGEIVGWRGAAIDHWRVATIVNGVTVGEARAEEMLDGPVGAARFLFELMAERGVALTPGQWISSGAVTGVHPVRVGDRVEARFGDALAATCRIKAA